MTLPTIDVSLPIADRAQSCEFYRALLQSEPLGEPAEDGIPEPLSFAVSDGMRLTLIPTGGFGWVIGDHHVAAAGHSECLFGWPAATAEAVDEVIARAREAGATVAVEPGEQPWGYSGVFADPDGHLWMVTPGF